MISIQTNVDSMLAQSNLSVDNTFQSKTIQQLTSGYKINSSGDNAAGLAIANGYRNQIAELTQGVSNANDGVSQLQIIDGGMNNISTILDRLNTLATQSASQTFTGNRGVLNSEFQSLVQEVDRQAQAIGLNTNGQFNKALSVFIGGGSGASSQAVVANGSITVDLSKAQVDTKTLGLKGVQAINSTSYDLGAASATSVSNIIADANNQTSAGGKQATFKFFGAGYSNATGNNSGLSVTVNLNGVSDTASLVNAINNAIQTAANGPTGADAQFKAANVAASVVTDSSGHQMLAFNSSQSSFQVTASDQMANALMGNFTSSSFVGAHGATAVTGAQANISKAVGSVSLSAGLDTSTNAITLTLANDASGAISGGPQTITLNANYASGTALVTAINTAISGNSNLSSAGISASLDASGKLQILSTKGTIDIKEADTNASTTLGLPGAGVGAAAVSTATTAVSYSTYAANGSSELGISGTASDLTFNAITAGTQAITVGANDASGNAHALTISLNSTNADNLADAAAALNTALQQSNDSTLQQITAVVQNDSGVQKINFVSTLPNFSVSLGSNAGGQGLSTAVSSSTDANGQATTLASTQVGSGGTADISTQQGAEAAVTALTAAVQILGNAQAAVGRGQNQLNYAQGLAQSQITNFSAAESRIRDTDVASAAANLTKSQVLTQTAIAAMAQANSEAQSVMKLLQ